jgi:hypothetical protein
MPRIRELERSSKYSIFRQGFTASRGFSTAATRPTLVPVGKPCAGRTDECGRRGAEFGALRSNVPWPTSKGRSRSCGRFHDRRKRSMRKMLLLLSLGLFSVSMAVAQDASPAGQATTPSPDSPNTSEGQSASDSSNSSASPIQGCLSGADGNYTLTQDGTGATYKLMGNETQLKKHVGHEVAVTGQPAADTGSASASNQGQGDTSASGAAGTTIQVTDVKMVSKQCMGSGSQTH